VPADYSFWDQHVAIQYVMGWQDFHRPPPRVEAEADQKRARCMYHCMALVDLTSVLMSEGSSRTPHRISLQCLSGWLPSIAPDPSSIQPFRGPW
jgi:hypothetical protein